MRQKGQIVLMLVLVMTVALAIGLSIVQKSLTDVSTATKVEDSQRAFSAAEAGIEKVLSGGGTQKFALEGTSAQVSEIQDSGTLPLLPEVNKRQLPLEFPPFAKEEIIQVWLADPDSNVRLPDCSAIDATKHSPICYGQSTLDLYWGNSQTDKAALELTLIYYDNVSKTYKNDRKWFLDWDSADRLNNFDKVNCPGSIVAEGSLDKISYSCHIKLGDGSINAGKNGALPSGLMMLRARLLYNTTSQPLAVLAVGTCGKNCSLPPQTRKLISVGASGQTQRKVQVFQMNKVIPPYFDFAIFSAGEIRK